MKLISELGEMFDCHGRSNEAIRAAAGPKAPMFYFDSFGGFWVRWTPETGPVRVPGHEVPEATRQAEIRSFR